MLDPSFGLVSLTSLPLALLTLMGLAIGSYLNVAIYRIPAGISTVYPGSRCPRCLMPIRAFDNVPLLGYLWLLARCRDCQGAISFRYPSIEAATAGFFLLSYRKFPEQPLEMAAGCMLTAVAVVLAMIDWDCRLVPLDIVVAGGIGGLLAQPILGWSSVPASLFAAALGALGLALASELWRRFAGQPGFAAGDVAVMAMIGAWLGPQSSLLTLALASVGVVPYWLYGRLRRSRHSDNVPFVFFLCFAMLAVLFLLPAKG